MRPQEIPLVFECEGSELIGMIHMPEKVLTRGLLSVVAGGPQYRGGVGRLQLSMARQLAANGTPVMRFDYRGLGDSEGRFRGFTDVEQDLRCALQAFAGAAPQLDEFVLWGGCDAASAVIINAWKFPQVTGIVLGNPWVHAEETAVKAELQHYGQRWKDPDFWKKVVRLQYNPWPAIKTIARGAMNRLAPAPKGSAATGGATADDVTAPFLSRMQRGLARYRGDLLLLMSGRSLLSREFDVLLSQDPAWRQALSAARHLSRHDIPDADQAFSTMAARAEVAAITSRWLHDVHAVPYREPSE